MKVLFFDVVPTNIIRFFERIVGKLIDKGCLVYFLFEHDDGKSIKDVEKTYPYAEEISYCQFKNIKWFEKYLVDNDINIIFFNAQRLPDDRVIIAAKNVGVKTYMFQHGMYIPFMKRNVSFFISQIKKTFSFLYYAHLISQAVSSSNSMIFKYIKAYVFGGNQIRIGIDRSRLNVDHVFVYSNYWRDYHVKQFGYSVDNQMVVGTPDLEDVKQFTSLPTTDSICYIAQTLVEDGRLSRDKQLSFYKSLVDIVQYSGSKLIVKLHPRSDISLYSYLKASDFITLSREELPRCSRYIGHYSTLLSKAMYDSEANVIIYEFDDHPTPEYFVECASIVVKNTDDLNVSLSNRCASKRGNIHHYFESGEQYVDKIINKILE